MSHPTGGGRGTNQHAVKPLQPPPQPQDASVLAELADDPEPKRPPVRVPVLLILVVLAVVGVGLAVMAMVGIP